VKETEDLDPQEPSKSLLLYPLEILTKVVHILATHPEDSRQRIAAVRSELALLGSLRLPLGCETQRDRIFEELAKGDLRKWGMRKEVASRIADWILSLKDELQTLYEDRKQEGRSVPVGKAPN
jgi:hypothetical protein